MSCTPSETIYVNTNTESSKFEDLKCLLDKLPNNTRNRITARDVRDAVYTLWDRIDNIDVSGVSVLFTNNTEVPFDIGGIKSGSTFSDITMQDIWDKLLYPDPVFIDPSIISYTSSHSGLFIVVAVISITLSATFSRGSINPSYNGPELRSGPPVQYIYEYSGATKLSANIGLEDITTIPNYEVIEGTQSFTASVSYAGGDQPSDFKGDNFGDPLNPGIVATQSIDIIGVYPYFATSEFITQSTTQSLVNHYSEEFEFFEFSLVKDLQEECSLTASHKQYFEAPLIYFSNQDNLEPTGVKQFNTNSGEWAWICGSKEDSLESFQNNFTSSQIIKDINGNNINYVRFDYTGPTIGFRKLRIFIN
jgi:hypothetical protein